MPCPSRTEQTIFAARLLPWLPPQECVVVLGRVSHSMSDSVRAVFDVEAMPGEDLRPLLLGKVPDYGTLRVHACGVFLSGAIQQPFHRNVRLAPVAKKPAKKRRGKPQPLDRIRPTVELCSNSLYGLVEFQCARLCLDCLILKSEPLRERKEEEERSKSSSFSSSGPSWSQIFRISVEGTLFCQDCVFEAELTLTPPLCEQSQPLASVIERCRWACSPGQGLLICGLRPNQAASAEQEDSSVLEALTNSGMTALRRFAGELDFSSTNLVVPNGLRFCIVKNCEAYDVRHHALFLRWDVFVLVEGCALHGKVLIEDGPVVELHRNPHLVLQGQHVDPNFVGTVREGSLEEAKQLPPIGPAVRKGRRRGTESRSASKNKIRYSALEDVFKRAGKRSSLPNVSVKD